MARTHVLILGDQLNRQLSTLENTDPNSTSVLMIESLGFGRQMPHHKQKLVHCFSSMRHFAVALEDEGFSVHYKRAEDSFASGIEKYLNQFSGVTLRLAAPNDTDFAPALRAACEEFGGQLELVPNNLWLSDEAAFDEWATDRKELRMEYFYRNLRKRYGYLMRGDGEPVGGRWNFDKDNRKSVAPDQRFPEPPRFEPDEITREVIDFVDTTFPDNFGTTKGFSWAVTRADALAALDDFCKHRLRDFGPFEDAMLQDEPQLYHSLLSPLINVGLLHPKEVIEAALDHFEDGRRNIPINSIEGFVRQILGWREFIFRVYKYRGLNMRDSNSLNQQRALPAFYWSGDTEMNCLKQCITQLKNNAHNHHIQRLMVLNNFALIAGVNPQELLAWFTSVYIDALEWVMVPNVIGMGQYADGGKITTKPYAASANYINKMSNYCQHCAYRASKRVGEDACPFNSLYWDFLERHKASFAGNMRMNMMLANLEKLKDKDAVLARAEDVKRKLNNGTL